MEIKYRWRKKKDKKTDRQKRDRQSDIENQEYVSHLFGGKNFRMTCNCKKMGAYKMKRMTARLWLEKTRCSQNLSHHTHQILYGYEHE